MRTISKRSLVLSTFVLALAGCGDAEAAPDGGSVTDSGAIVDAFVPVDATSPSDAAAPVDAAAPTDAAAPIDAGVPAASVAWTTEVDLEPIDSDVALDFFLQYELMIEGDPFVYGLTLEICIAMAGRAETCTTQARENLPGAAGVRWGVDPSMYAIGENHYRFRLILDRDGATVAEDLLDMQLDVTDCMMCVGR